MHIHLIIVPDEFLPALPCCCATLRRASRALTQLYEEALHALGLRATQFTLLQTLGFAGEVTQRELGRMLAMDSTTLTGTLCGIQSWVSRQRGKDRREWRISLSEAGKAELARVLPVWQSVQQRFRLEIGDAAWDSLFEMANRTTQAAIRITGANHE